MNKTRKFLAGAVAAAALAATSVHAADNAAPRAGWGDCGNAVAGSGYGPRAGMGPGAGHGQGMMSRVHGGFGAGNPAAIAAGHLAALKVERLAKRTEAARQHIAAMETMTAAVKELYAALTPEQKKTADDLLTRGPMGGQGGMGGAGFMGRGHGFRS